MLDPTKESTESAPTLADYAAALASIAPSPGGGSAVAVTAAIAAALGEKVCRFSIGKPASAEHEASMTATLNRFALARAQLFQLAADDEEAYGIYAQASALPKATVDERVARKSAMTAALQDAAAVPLDVATKAIEVLAALETVARFGNRNLVSDVSVAGYLAEAAICGSVSLVHSNTSHLRNLEASNMSSLATRLEREGRALNKIVQEVVDSEK